MEELKCIISEHNTSSEKTFFKCSNCDGELCGYVADYPNPFLGYIYCPYCACKIKELKLYPM